ncbi:hypothetical protein PGT21_013609 [Puccinia graminis f. sp. tritici]|uniref:Uncharacterized protein n=1 Tax=Puccinia graminis f. sp. tritici TaxID=56615 RepID=A0A5B0N8Q0_PUCGR|nr:hypothetical protein PGT21_013609 [Puccinia graminis f. sp. tritici]KAA1136047.1 hypothetical protein PGTUg99_024840 [Puccinia graminis f. sp. tritici]
MALIPCICTMVLISLYLFTFFIKIDSQPISPQKIAAQHAALMPRNPDMKNPSPAFQDQSLRGKAVLPLELQSLRRRSIGQGMTLSTSNVQSRVSSFSGHTGSAVAGPEKTSTNTTPLNRTPSSSHLQSTAATPGSNGGRSAPVDASKASTDRTHQPIPPEKPKQPGASTHQPIPPEKPKQPGAGTHQPIPPEKPNQPGEGNGYGSSVCWFDGSYDCW